MAFPEFRRLALQLALTVLLGLLLPACRASSGQGAAAQAGEEPRSLTELLAGGDTAGYARALEVRPFRFPDDHGAHPEFRSEWWYLTGNLTAADGRRFGYQFTLFRNAVSPDAPQRESPWATNQVFMAHLALSDVDGRAFRAFERFSRGAAGLAGVTARPFRAWLEDWTLTASEPTRFHLAAAADGIGLELVLASAKPVVLQGEQGLSRKGREPGNASYYYSFTRMSTRGVVTVDYTSLPVQGSSWLDREWSTSALEADQVGWDWFALQLSDGRDLMVYRLRRTDGGTDPMSSGTLIARDGKARRLEASDYEILPLAEWKSPATQVRYPSKWRLTVPSAELDLEVTPVLPAQELSLSVRYWEGAVDVRGRGRTAALTGQGYVELTGYE